MYFKLRLSNAPIKLIYFSVEFSELTNWTPVSLRMPTPAEAKLAPTSNFSPVSSGLKYGNVASSPMA